MILEMKNYKYPSKEEWEEVSNLFPILNGFGFKEIHFSAIWNREKSLEEAHISKNLQQWDKLLNKKLWNLQQAFTNAKVNYKRGIAISKDEFKDQMKVIQLLQFELYCEMSFYYLISTREVILQIINFAFELGIPEKGRYAVSIGTVKKKLKESNNFCLFGIVQKVSEDLSEANEIRNSMAHSFSKLDPDDRSTLSEDGSRYAAGTRYFIKHDKQVEILNESLESLSVFFHAVRDKLVEKGYVLDAEQ